MNHIFGGRTRWEEAHPGETKTYIVLTIEIRRHTIEQCRVLKDHLEQLAKVGYLKEFVMDLKNQETGQGAWLRGNPLPPLLGVIEVIHAASRGTIATKRRRVLGCPQPGATSPKAGYQHVALLTELQRRLRDRGPISH